VRLPRSRGKTQEGFFADHQQSARLRRLLRRVEENDMGTSISLFDSQAQAETSMRLAADWVKQNMTGLIIGT